MLFSEIGVEEILYAGDCAQECKDLLKLFIENSTKKINGDV